MQSHIGGCNNISTHTWVAAVPSGYYPSSAGRRDRVDVEEEEEAKEKERGEEEEGAEPE